MKKKKHIFLRHAQADSRQQMEDGSQKSEVRSLKTEDRRRKSEDGNQNEQNNFSDIAEGTLYIVPTPIGNLDDITLRAIKVLPDVDIIACEDTRHTGILLKNLSIIPKKLISYHEHNEKSKSFEIIEEIKSGKKVALVSDAGSPLISDPGFPLIRLATEHNIKIIALPGATAFVPALSASGFPTNRFVFMGFAPQKKGRLTFIQELINIQSTIILYESSHRIIKLLDELNSIFEDSRQICIAREISKIHEEYIRGTANYCKEQLHLKQKVKGEFVVIIDAIKD
ncbi:MAG: 16S rRNA (cytidine(1402)-2'-O)-methyltransferase [bacterium]